MPVLTWANLVVEADIEQPTREWTEAEREEWQGWVDVWNSDAIFVDRYLAIKTAEWLEEIFNAGTPYRSLTGLYLWVYHQVSMECLGFSGVASEALNQSPFIGETPRTVLSTELQGTEEEDTPQEPPVYAEDDYEIDWTQPVIFRGEKRNGDGGLFYLHVPWHLVPGNELRAFLRAHVGIAKGYKGMTGFKLGGVKYVRTLPLAGQVNKKPVSYIDRTIEALLANGASIVQERRVVNTEELCTGSCQGAHPWSPCECCCGGEGHGGGSILPGADYTIYKGDLIIEGKRQIIWKVYR